MDYQRINTTDSDFIILGLYATFGLYQVVNRGTYRPHHKSLPWHIVSGGLEVVLYYAGLQCSLLAVAANLMHSFTSLVLVKKLPNGYPPHTRPTYQAGSIMRPAQIIYAYYTKDPVHYHDAMMPLNAFVYTRAIIFILGTMGPSRSFAQNVNNQIVYTEAVFGAALISVAQCSSPWALVAYLGLVNLIGKFNRRKDEFSKETNAPSSTSAKKDAKVPQIGYLPMDYIGHWWTRVDMQYFKDLSLPGLQ